MIDKVLKFFRGEKVFEVWVHKFFCDWVEELFDILVVWDGDIDWWIWISWWVVWLVE